MIDVYSLTSGAIAHSNITMAKIATDGLATDVF